MCTPALVLTHCRCDVAERSPALLHPLPSLLEVEGGQIATAVPKDELEELTPMFGKGNVLQQV